MYKKHFIIILLFSLTLRVFSLNYITTAESISWNGAYSSVADGFEAMLYNPAGLYYSSTRYGFNIFGSYGVRLYSNSISSDDIIKALLMMQEGKNLTDTGVLSKILLYMPESGMDVGIDLSALNVMTYFKFDKFSLGFSVLPKTSVTATASKGIFNTLFNEIDLTAPLSYNLKGSILQYIDFNTILSTRAKFLEKYIPVDKIFVGLSSHFYYPTAFVKTSSSVQMAPGDPDPSTGFLSGYKLRIKGDLIFGSNGLVTAAASNSSYLQENGSALINYGGSAAFGLGLDAGFMIEFNKFVRLGFAMTDIGFIVFPQTAKIAIDVESEIGLDSLNDFANAITAEIADAIEDANGAAGGTEWWMPGTAFRVGVAVTPLKKGMLTWATDISLADLNRLLFEGYPTFNFSTGIEFVPSYRWFSVPLRLAFCYNSQANAPSFSTGIGFYFGPVELEFAIKGLEFLISGWGAREVCAGVDLKFEF